MNLTGRSSSSGCQRRSHVPLSLAIAAIGLAVVCLIVALILHERSRKNRGRRQPGNLSPDWHVQSDDRTYRGYREGERD